MDGSGNSYTRQGTTSPPSSTKPSVAPADSSTGEPPSRPVVGLVVPAARRRTCPMRPSAEGAVGSVLIELGASAQSSGTTTSPRTSTARAVGYLIRASRSASSSHLVAARTTSSRAGIRPGKTDLSNPSRSSPFVVAAAILLALVEARDPAPVELLDERDVCARWPDARADCPATPCARLRCAPRAAARLNVRPHSGQTNSPPPATVSPAREEARLLVPRFLPVDCRLDVATSSLPLPIRQ